MGTPRAMFGAMMNVAMLRARAPKRLAATGENPIAKVVEAQPGEQRGNGEDGGALGERNHFLRRAWF